MSVSRNNDREYEILESIKDCIFFVDGEGIIVFVNHSLELALGYKKEELNGSHFSVIFSIGNRPGLEADIMMVTWADSSWTGDVLFCDSDNNEKYFEFKTSAIIDSENNYAGFSAVGRDISERMELMRLITESNGLLKKVTSSLDSTIASLPEGVVVTDNSLNIIKINRVVEEILGVRANELLGKSLLMSISVEPLNNLVITALKSPNELVTGEFDIVNGFGRKMFLRAKVSHILDESRESIGLVVILSNISREKEFDNLKSDFLSIVSHELRTPLTAIIGFASILLEEKDLLSASENQNYLSTILKNGNHLLELINDLLDISQLESNKIRLRQRETNVRDLAIEVLNSQCRLALEKGIKITAEVDEAIPDFIYADEPKVKQVLTNIINNAIKFTPVGGSIGLCVRDFATVVEFAVSDSGIGIPVEKASKLFENFYQADSTTTRKFGGAGLGLAMCKKIVELHNGAIWMEPRAPQGSVFRFTLPYGNQAGINEEKVFRIGYVPVLDHAVAMLTQQICAEGKNCAEISWVRCHSWAELSDRIIRRQLDGAFMMVPMLLNFLANGIPLKTLFVAHRNGACLTSGKSGVMSEKTLYDSLCGSKIGVPHRYSTHHFLLYGMAEKFCGKLGRDVIITIVGDSEVAAAFEYNRIDAAFTSEPVSNELGKLIPGSFRLYSGKVSAEHACCVFTCLENAMVSNNSIIEKLIGLMSNASMMIRNDPAFAAERIAPFVSASVEDIKKVLSNRDAIIFDGTIPKPEDFSEFLRIARSLRLFIDDGMLNGSICDSFARKFDRDGQPGPLLPNFRMKRLEYSENEKKFTASGALDKGRTSERKILVCDDNPEVREIIKASLSSLPCKVSTCSNGAEALLLVSKDAPDILIIDISMPVLGGLETIRILRSRNEYSKMPIVLMRSSHAISDEEPVNGEANGNGADEVIIKPFRASEVRDSVLKLVKGLS